MQQADFARKKVALLGAGIENVALVPWLQKAGAEVTVCNEQETDALKELRGQNTRVVVGEHYLNDLGRFDYLFRIAGMPISRVEAALKDIAIRPIVTSPTNLFLALKPCHIIGVTGTKGKGTTSTLIGSLLTAGGFKAVVVGNIGKPIFSIIDDLTPDSYAVVELSSFQLEDVTNSPEIAVLLPIGEDHLEPSSTINPNFHPTLVAYRSAKANITAFQQSTDLLVYAADSATAGEIADNSSARRVGVGKDRGDLLVSESGQIKVNDHELIDLAELGLSGQHIFLDAALAIAVAREVGIDAAMIAEGIHRFKPLPHRLETFLEKDGVRYVDDSYATAPDATIMAIEAFDQPIIWLAGGVDQGAGFTELGLAAAKSSVKCAILFGKEAGEIEKALRQAGFNWPIKIVYSLDQAVGEAQGKVLTNDVVLLSPACKSFDMFKNAADRGEQFQQLVKKYATAV